MSDIQKVAPKSEEKKGDFIKDYYWYVKSNKAIRIKTLLSEIE